MAERHSLSEIATAASSPALSPGHAIAETVPALKPAIIVSSEPGKVSDFPARRDSKTHAAFVGSQQTILGLEAPNIFCNPPTIAPASPPTPACTKTASGIALHCSAASAKS